MGVKQYHFENSSPLIAAASVTSYIGFPSAGTRSYKTAVLGAVPIVGPAETGENSIAQNATDVPTASRFHVKTATEVGEDTLLILPALFEMLPF